MQLKKVSSHLYLKEGVLYFDHRFEVPTVLRKEVLERVHALGHFGMARTLEALRQSYYWPKMARNAKLYMFNTSSKTPPYQLTYGSNHVRLWTYGVRTSRMIS